MINYCWKTFTKEVRIQFMVRMSSPSRIALKLTRRPEFMSKAHHLDIGLDLRRIVYFPVFNIINQIKFFLLATLLCRIFVRYPACKKLTRQRMLPTGVSLYIFEVYCHQSHQHCDHRWDKWPWLLVLIIYGEALTTEDFIKFQKSALYNYLIITDVAALIRMGNTYVI